MGQKSHLVSVGCQDGREQLHQVWVSLDPKLSANFVDRLQSNLTSWQDSGIVDGSLNAISDRLGLQRSTNSIRSHPRQQIFGIEDLSAIACLLLKARCIELCC